MPVNTIVAFIIVFVCVLVLVAYICYIAYSITDILLRISLTKKLHRALDNSLISYCKSKNFNNTMMELEEIIQQIIKPNKYFSISCHSVDGLLREYVYWLNTGHIHPKADVTELKNTAHSLIEQYRESPYTSEAQLYEEPLLNEASKSLSKKDFEGVQRALFELDMKIAKERKKSKTIYIWLPHAATIIGTIAAAIISSLLK